MNSYELIGKLVIIIICIFVIGWVITLIGRLFGFRTPPDPDDPTTWYK